MSDSSRLQRREVHYLGRVQGVGFRFTALRIAQRFHVTGYVRNLSDGRVQLVAEGVSSELEGFLREVGQQMRGNIDEAQMRTLTASGEFNSFQVRS